MPDAGQPPSVVAPRQHAVPTRLAHLAVVAAVAAQLATGSVMAPPPKGGGGSGDAWFAAHTLLGFEALVAVALLWLAVLASPGGEGTPPGMLFPWLSARGRAALLRDLRRVGRRLRAGRLPRAADTARALAPAVHGLGLLVVTAVVATGALGWYAGLRALLAVHPALVTLLWVYLGGHAGFALLHEVAGEGRLGHMFLPRRRAPAAEGDGR